MFMVEESKRRTDLSVIISNFNNRPKLPISFVCPDCKAKKDAYLLTEKDHEDAEYTIAVCSGCAGLFDLQIGLDPKLVPPIREPTK